MMRRRTSFKQLFSSTPTRARLVIATLFGTVMTNFMGRKVINQIQSANLATNVETMLRDSADWSCFYYAKQYREECTEYNRLTGGEYIETICANLEKKMAACQDDLAKEVAKCRPYAMEAPMEVDNKPSWLELPSATGRA
ncbi:uncharacterized protein BBOV_IV001410 [Babesia bovis T2Bo]|uniref:Uncharacterized protein n=1 Tax=Babesia bovis TaxID=5865 RepID=A7AVB2_BABBO|nr:uncharacterized protein BBOV_IV001410 [Babesia bovis T2Bo]EDO05738.1 hypothetical protein BBOV_IV001410 [Babesia bovis T2Bo]|eukprot:XP_001609306.1 hypothetical protein [Babesia bovis T2Bo]